MAGILDAIRGWTRRAQPRAAVQSAGGGVTIATSQDLERVVREMVNGSSGAAITPTTAMRNSIVYRCVTLISGAVGNMPCSIKRWVSPGVREDAPDEPVAELLQRRPNSWQTPKQFKQMLQAHICLRGNAYALKVASRGRIVALVPMHPDQVRCDQLDNFELAYTYTRRDGRQIVLPQKEVMHLVGLSLDGVTGISPISYQREVIAMAQAQEAYGASTFRNGARISSVLSHPGKLGKEGLANLRASLEMFRQGGENEGKDLILEEGMSVTPMAMTNTDAEWIASRKLSQTDIAMIFGVPPHMLGLTDKSTSWGSGIAEQGQGFVTYTLEDHLVMWEETIARDLIPENRRDLYARFNRGALVRGDIEKRYKAYSTALQWGFMSPDEVRALEDLNPRPDGGGNKFYDPPNTAGGGQEEPAREPEADA